MPVPSTIKSLSSTIAFHWRLQFAYLKTRFLLRSTGQKNLLFKHAPVIGFSLIPYRSLLRFGLEVILL
jgi:hypothetical protein